MTDYSQSLGPCPTCQSIRYTQNRDGFFICEHGHQSQKIWEEQQDEYEPGVAASRRLRLKKSTGTGSLAAKKAALTAEVEALLAEERNYIRSGEVDRFVILEALQVILKAQIEAVKNISEFWNQPYLTDRVDQLKSEFEDKTKQVWFAYVSALKICYEERDLRHQPNHSVTSETAKLHPSAEDLSFEYDFEMNFSDGDEDDEEGEENNNNDGDILNDDFDEIGPGDLDEINKFKVFSGIPFGSDIRLPTLLLIIYVGLIKAGLPVFLSDIVLWTQNDQLPFFHARKLLPKRLLIRMNHLQQRFFRTKKLYSAQELLMNLPRFLNLLGQTSSIPQEPLDTNLLVTRSLREFGLPAGYSRYVTAHVNLADGKKFIFSSKLGFVTPCMTVTTSIIYFTKLLYGLSNDTNDQDEEVDCLRSLYQRGFPRQEDLINFWRKRMDLFFDPMDENDERYLKDEDFLSLVTFCERFLSKSGPNIDTVVSDVFRSFNSPPGPAEHLITRQIHELPTWIDSTLPDDFILPTGNFSSYQMFQEDLLMEHDLVDRPYRIILDFAGKLTGLLPYKLHELVQRLHESRKIPVNGQ